LIRDPQHKFRPQALLSTDVRLSPTQMVTSFVQRWQVEVTFQEVRTHLGVETQRQWADLAIARTTPTLLGLFSVVTLLAHSLSAHQEVAPRQAAWYTKPTPTFADALALVRSHLWRHTHFALSQKDYDLVQIRTNPAPAFRVLNRHALLRCLMDKVQLRQPTSSPAALQTASQIGGVCQPGTPPVSSAAGDGTLAALLQRPDKTAPQTLPFRTPASDSSVA
jgi:hypothetical protein